MTNHRISTTIPHKHWELLNRYVEKFGTQQKVLEIALESLENNLTTNPLLNKNEMRWALLRRANTLVVVEKTAFKLLIETADVVQMNELFIRDKPVEYAIEFYNKKPLKECSLIEVIEGLVDAFESTNWFDTVDYTEDITHYTIKIGNSLGLKLSELTATSVESALETYGVKAKSTVSTKTIYIKVFK